MIEVVRAGPLTTVQDLGRPGWAHLGVPRSGALDVAALRRANALVGNPSGAAGLETTLGGCAVRVLRDTVVAVTGATARVRVDGADAAPVTAVGAGTLLDVGPARAGVRSYLAFAGGIAVEPVLGSRSTDSLSGLGPPRLTDGMTLPLGPPPRPPLDPAGDPPLDPAGDPPLDPAGDPPRDPSGSPPLGRSRDGSPGDLPLGRSDELVLRVRLGPRDDWFADPAALFGVPWTVTPLSNRVGVRLAGPPLTRAVTGELASEGVVLGAIQVPSDGLPLIFLADHPTTGGYPVIGVVDDVTPLAQARPGSTVTFTLGR